MPCSCRFLRETGHRKQLLNLVVWCTQENKCPRKTKPSTALLSARGDHKVSWTERLTKYCRWPPVTTTRPFFVRVFFGTRAKADTAGESQRARVFASPAIIAHCASLRGSKNNPEQLEKRVNSPPPPPLHYREKAIVIVSNILSFETGMRKSLAQFWLWFRPLTGQALS